MGNQEDRFCINYTEDGVIKLHSVKFRTEKAAILAARNVVSPSKKKAKDIIIVDTETGDYIGLK